jgi:hypothetical protein
LALQANLNSLKQRYLLNDIKFLNGSCGLNVDYEVWLAKRELVGWKLGKRESDLIIRSRFFDPYVNKSTGQTILPWKPVKNTGSLATEKMNELRYTIPM